MSNKRLSATGTKSKKGPSAMGATTSAAPAREIPAELIDIDFDALDKIQIKTFLPLWDLIILTQTLVTQKPVNIDKAYTDIRISNNSPLLKNYFFYRWNFSRPLPKGSKYVASEADALFRLAVDAVLSPGSNFEAIRSYLLKKAALDANLDTLSRFYNGYIQAYKQGKLRGDRNYFTFNKSYLKVTEILENHYDSFGDSFTLDYAFNDNVRLYEILMYMRQQKYIEIEDSIIEPSRRRLIFTIRIIKGISTIRDDMANLYFEGLSINLYDKVSYNGHVLKFSPGTDQVKVLKLLFKRRRRIENLKEVYNELKYTPKMRKKSDITETRKKKTPYYDDYDEDFDPQQKTPKRRKRADILAAYKDRLEGTVSEINKKIKSCKLELIMGESSGLSIKKI